MDFRQYKLDIEGGMRNGRTIASPRNNKYKTEKNNVCVLLDREKLRQGRADQQTFSAVGQHQLR